MEEKTEIITKEEPRTEEPKTIEGIMTSVKFKSELSEVLPKLKNNLSVQRFIYSTIAALRNVRDIDKCSLISIKKEVIKAASYGFVPGTRQYYLIARNNKITNQMELSGEPGPDGYKELAMRGGDIKDIYAVEIYKADEFEHDPVTQKINKHTQPISNRTGKEEDILGVYAVALFNDGSTRIVVRSKSEIDLLKALNESVKKGYKSAYDTSYVGMLRTKALKALCNELPKTVELLDLIENDEDNEISPKHYIDAEVVDIVEDKSTQALGELHKQLNKGE